MSKSLQALLIAAIIFGIAYVLGHEHVGTASATVIALARLFIDTDKDKKKDQADGGRRIRVRARIDDGFMAGLLAGLMISVALMRGYLTYAESRTLAGIEFASEVAFGFIPATAIFGIAIAMVDAWALSKITARTWLLNEIVLAMAVAAGISAPFGAAMGWYFSQYRGLRPFTPPELLLAGCIPAGAVIGIALAIPHGKRMTRALVLPFVMIALVITSFTIVAVVVADATALGPRLAAMSYQVPVVPSATKAGAAYGLITGGAVGITAGVTMLLLRQALTAKKST